MKKAQGLTLLAGVLLITALYFGGRTKPLPNEVKSLATNSVENEVSIDSILFHAKEMLTPDQVTRLQLLERSVIRGDVKSQQMNVFHQLAHFWKDSARIFEPYAWYEAESARLENSEKTLTFAARLFLDNLQGENNPVLKKWKALQAKDLFERSLKLNNQNDSSIVGLGACYIFGGIADNPMEGILKVRQVVEKDSTNIYGQMVLGHGSVISGQYDKAIDRFEKVIRLQPDNLEANMMLGEVNERKGDNQQAIIWYTKAKELVNNDALKEELQKRIEELKK